MSGLAERLSACQQIYEFYEFTEQLLHFTFRVLSVAGCHGPQTSYKVTSLTPAVLPNGFWSLFSTDDPGVADSISSEGSAGRTERNFPFARSGVRS